MITLEEISKFSAKDLWQMYEKYVGSGYAKILSSLTLGEDIFVSAEGMYMYTKSNKKILDFTGGFGVLNHGHNHPKILKARIDFQVKKNMEVHKIVFSPFVAALSHNVANLLPGDLNKCFFPNSGAEANEGALKLAYLYHKGDRDYVMHSDIAFHGKLIASGSLAANYPDNEGYQKLPHTQSFKFNSIKSVRDRLKPLTKNGKSNVYAIIVEPFSASQCRASSEEFLIELRRICDQNNIILIFDEVFSGWGKTGYLFNFMKCENLYPDILTMSKSFGGGKASISCYVTRDKIFNAVYGSAKTATKHSSTYSGFGEETITAIEAIRIVVEENYPHKVRKIDTYMTSRLQEIKNKYPKIIKEVRGEGTLKCLVLLPQFEFVQKLIKAIPIENIKNKSEIISKIVGASIIEELYKEHNILIEAGPRRTVLRTEGEHQTDAYIFVQPSCIVEEKHVDVFISGLDKTLEKGLTNLIKKFIENNLKRIFKK